MQKRAIARSRAKWVFDPRRPLGGTYAGLIPPALTQLGVLAGHPLAFLIVFAYAAAWLLFAPETFDWHGIATIAVWIMTLLIQRAENRDTQSIQAKLDELLHAHI